MHPGLITGKNKGKLSQSLFELLFCLFFLLHICSLRLILSANKFSACLSEYKVLKCTAPTKMPALGPNFMGLHRHRSSLPRDPICIRFQHLGQEIWLASPWSGNVSWSYQWGMVLQWKPIPLLRQAHGQGMMGRPLWHSPFPGMCQISCSFPTPVYELLILLCISCAQ